MIEQRHIAALSVERSYIDPRSQVTVNGFANTLTSDVTFLVSDHTRARVWSASPLTFALWYFGDSFLSAFLIHQALIPADHQEYSSIITIYLIGNFLLLSTISLVNWLLFFNC